MKDKKSNIGFRYAWNGICSAVKSERNLRIHLLCGSLATLVGFILQLTRIEWMILLLVIMSVLVAEIFNTVVEQLIDYIKPEIHPAAKFIKDAAAGAVLMTAITAVLIGCLLFIPRVIHLL